MNGNRINPNEPPQGHTGGGGRANAPSRHWLLWQLADSAFPSGAFAHSAGLEAAWQHWQVLFRSCPDGPNSPPTLAGALSAALEQAAAGAAPFALATRRRPEEFGRWDRACDVQTLNHVANRASRAQGRALLTAAQRIFAAPGLAPASYAVREGAAGHLAPVFGVVSAALDVSEDETARLFLFVTLRGLVSAAVRLGAAGPLEGQATQAALTPLAERLALDCLRSQPDDAAQTAPLLDLFQATHDRLYSRLFQS